MPLIDIDSLSTELAMSKSGIYQWVSQKKIPYYKIGRSVRFDPDEVKKWLQTKRSKPIDTI